MSKIRPLFCPGPYSDTWSIKCHASLLKFCSIKREVIALLQPSNVRCMCDMGPGPMSLAIALKYLFDPHKYFSAIASRDPSVLKTPIPRLVIEMGVI